MKNFTLGILLTLVCGLFYQNIILRQEVARYQSGNVIITPVMEAKKSVKKTQQNVAKKKVVKPTQISMVDGRDPSCPPHLPYRAGHWGCVVKRNP